MRQPTLDEAARIIDAGDAMAEELRAMLPPANPMRSDSATRWAALVDAWRDTTREVAP